MTALYIISAIIVFILACVVWAWGEIMDSNYEDEGEAL